MMINSPDTRVYLRHFKDLNRLFSVFTQADGVDKDPRKEILDKLLIQLNYVSKAIVNMIRTTHGLIYLASSPLGLASLIGALNQPIKLYKQLAILNLFIEIFDVPLYVGGNIYLSSTSTGPGQSQNLLNNYVALLLQAFYRCGVYEALIRVGIQSEENSELNIKSRFLLKKIMYLSSSLLPEVPQVASLVNIATDFDEPSEVFAVQQISSNENQRRSRATKIIKELSEISLRNPLEVNKESQVNFQHQFTISDFPEFFMMCYDHFNQATHFKLDLQTYYYRADLFFDAQKLEAKIIASKVLKYKVRDFRDWDFPLLLELFENDGVLWNNERLEHHLERTKFIKRLLKFYMPYKEMFVKLPWRQDNLIYARVGYLLLKTLLKWPIGTKTLIGKQFILYLTPGAIIEDNDNPFYQKKSFIQDVEIVLQREFMKFEKDKQETLKQMKGG